MVLMVQMENKTDAPVEMFAEKDMVKMCAPMVRYSKLQFRTLVRRFGCDLTFTPMIVSKSFVQSQKARHNEFTTNSDDKPLIVQFAANNAKDLADATELVARHSNGVDINCGCPQRWALSEGYGAYLINEPELVRDMVLQTKNRISNSQFSISMKIRIHNDIRRTVEFCRRAEHCGISWITVHSRTTEQQKEPIDVPAIKTIVDSIHIPVVGNGDIFSLEDAFTLQAETGVKGVMTARGILQNPALFAGYKYTPEQCIKEWLDISMQLGTHFTTFHHHLMFMLDKILPRTERRVFNILTSFSSVIDYLKRYTINDSIN